MLEKGLHPKDLAALLGAHKELAELFYHKSLLLYLKGNSEQAVSSILCAMAHYRHLELPDDFSATSVMLPNATYERYVDLMAARSFAQSILDDKRWSSQKNKFDYLNIRQHLAMQEYFS